MHCFNSASKPEGARLFRESLIAYHGRNAPTTAPTPLRRENSLSFIEDFTLPDGRVTSNGAVRVRPSEYPARDSDAKDGHRTHGGG